MDFKTLNLLFRCGKEFGHKRILKKELSDTEYMLCSCIYAHPDCSQDEAATILKTDKTTVAKALASLEKKSCIVRTRDASDKRRNCLRLTQLGHDKIADLLDIHDEWLSSVLQCLTDDEQKQLENYCERLLEAAEALEKRNMNGGESDATGK